jgi:hypothetical protein
VKPLLLIGVVCAAGILGAGLWLSWSRQHSFVTATREYATLEAAIKEGVVSNGWLPEFTPHSARDIREQHNFEQNTAIAAFSFDPTEDLSTTLRSAKEWQGTSTSDLHPPSLGKRASWFSESVARGNFQDLKTRGFRIYQIREQKWGAEINWRLAIDRKAGRGYIWN